MGIRIGINGFGRIGRHDLPGHAGALPDMRGREYRGGGRQRSDRSGTPLPSSEVRFGPWGHEAACGGRGGVDRGGRASHPGLQDPSKIPWEDLHVDLVIYYDTLFSNFDSF